MKKLELPPLGATAVKWKAGMKRGGFLVSIKSPAGADSRLITLDVNGKAHDLVSVWETAALAQYMPLLKPGDFVWIECTGEKEYKRGRGWDFDVSIPGTPQETLELVRKAEKIFTDEDLAKLLPPPRA
jgi:hypothetical protein